MRVFVQQAFKAGRQSVFGVTDSMAVPEFIALLVESGRITDVDEVRWTHQGFHRLRL